MTCKDLLMALLKHNPSDRITYDEFFAHDFLDLEHAATKENYDSYSHSEYSSAKLAECLALSSAAEF